MRLDPNNKDDRDFLQKHRDPQTGRTLLEEQVAHEIAVAAKTSGGGGKNRLERNLDEKTATPRRGSKMRNTCFERGGMTWDSEYEYHCWLLLLELQRRGVIFKLARQVRFVFRHNGVKLFSFIADYTFDLRDYGEDSDERTPDVVADAKSEFVSKFMKYRWQKNAMLAFYRRSVLEFIKGRTDVQNLVANLVGTCYDGGASDAGGGPHHPSP